MARTSRGGIRARTERATPAPETRVTTRTTADMPAVTVVEDLLRDLQNQVSALAPGPDKRALVADIRRYERVTWRWVSVAPTNEQREAVRERLNVVAERVARAMSEQRAAEASRTPTRRFRRT